MAPKNKETKADQAKKAKKAEDLTFGLKNKNKSKKVQQYVNQVKHQVTGNNQSIDKKAAEQAKAKKEKDAIDKQKALLANLTRAAKKIEKAEEEVPVSKKIDIYTDPRDGNTAVDMDAIAKNIAKTTGKTMITCKYFLEAVESQNYGWFWVCPNGVKCIYRHNLPLGYVLKKDRPKDVVEDPEYLDVDIEIARSNLNPSTPVNQETFTKWRTKVLAEREAQLKKIIAEEASNRKKKKQGDDYEKSMVSGKDLFQLNPELFVDDEGAAMTTDLKEDEEYLDQLRAEEEQMAQEHFKLQDEMRRAAQEMGDVDISQFMTEDLDGINLD